MILWNFKYNKIWLASSIFKEKLKPVKVPSQIHEQSFLENWNIIQGVTIEIHNNKSHKLNTKRYVGTKAKHIFDIYFAFFYNKIFILQRIIQIREKLKNHKSSSLWDRI